MRFCSDSIGQPNSSKKLFCLILFLLLSPFVSASSFFDPIRNKILFQHIDIDSNLPHPTVIDIIQDQEGFIWFATQGGLTKYNGSSAKIYTSSLNENSGLNNQWFWQVFSDSEGRIWGTSKGGIHLYMPETDSFINFTSDNDTRIKQDYITIAEDKNGNLWFGGKENGFEIFDTKTSTFSSLGLLSKTHQVLINSFVQDIKFSKNDGTMWVATLDKGIFRSEDNGKTFININTQNSQIPTNKIVRLFVDSDNQVWAGTEGDGLLLLSAKGKFVANYTSDKCSAMINDVLVDQNHKVWLATPNGVCEFNPQNESFTVHQKDLGRTSSLINNDVKALMQDAGGVIWAATASGVSKWNAKLADFTHISQMNAFGNLTSSSITSFAQNNNSLFLGTVDGGINYISFNSKKFRALDSQISPSLKKLENSLVTSLMTDGDQSIWIGTFDNGLFNFNFETQKLTNYSPESIPAHQLSHESVSKIIKLRDGNIAIATYGSHINLFDTKTNAISQLKFRDRSKGEFLNALDLYEDNKGILWIATHGGGLVSYDRKKNKTVNYSTKQLGYKYIPSDEIFSVIQTEKGIWLATSDAGVILLDQRKSHTQTMIDHNKGLATNFTYGLLEDDLGFIWVSHAKGLSRIDPDTLAINNFNTTHGLQSSDFNNSAYYKAANGRLFFGGSNGFNTFMPNEVPINSYQPPLKLTKFVHANEVKPIQSMLRPDGVLELNYEDTIVDFEFAALDYTKPSNNRYQYMMEGLNSKWSNIGTSNHISFSYLTDGNYMLRVRGSNNEEVWSEELVIPIEVLPPIWKTVHAKLLYIFGPILIFLQILRNQRIKHQRQLSHERRLHQLAYFDGLTGLPNRQSFYENLDKFISLAKRGNYKAGVMFIDLDRFKRINDTLGHDYGDLVLQEVAQRLKECVRDSDFVARNYEVSAFNNEIARLGGDEFTLFLSHVDSATETTFITERIIECLSRPINIDHYELTVTPSIGIALYPEHGTTVHELMKNADIAMYQAKEEGRRTFKFYSNHLNDRALERLQLEEKMRSAVTNNEFVLYYQPQVDIVSNEVTKAEALIRWVSPELGFISPSDFIPIAEESGLIIELGNWILDTACSQAKQWYDSGLTNCKVSVNVSSVQFKQTALIDNVKSALEKSGLPPEMLELELTESAVMSDVDDNIERLQQFKDMGITIAIDDFGTGYSSLSYLKKFPIDTLKIDRSFIIDVATSDNDAAIVRAIMLLAKAMELKVVAEGVEELEQLKILNDYRCQLIQGYYFSRPLPSDEFLAFVNVEFEQNKINWQFELAMT